MRRLLASYRFRRRLLRAAVLLTAVGAGAVVSVLFWNTANVPATPFSNEPAQTFVAPVPVALSASERRSALAVAAKFVRTAVRRERMAEAFHLVGPSIKQGMTLEEWTTQDVAVVPYPVDFAKWKVDYSFEGELGLQVYVFPDAERRLRPMIFEMSLRAVGSGEKRRWIVDAWIPKGGAPSSVRPNREGNRWDIGSSIRQLPPAKPRLGPEWLLFPFVLVAGSLLLIPVTLVVRERRRTARARAHAQAWEERYRESSSPS